MSATAFLRHYARMIRKADEDAAAALARARKELPTISKIAASERPTLSGLDKAKAL